MHTTGEHYIILQTYNIMYVHVMASLCTIFYLAKVWMQNDDCTLSNTHIGTHTKCMHHIVATYTKTYIELV